MVSPVATSRVSIAACVSSTQKLSLLCELFFPIYIHQVSVYKNCSMALKMSTSQSSTTISFEIDSRIAPKSSLAKNSERASRIWECARISSPLTINVTSAPLPLSLDFRQAANSTVHENVQKCDSRLPLSTPKGWLFFMNNAQKTPTDCFFAQGSKRARKCEQMDDEGTSTRDVFTIFVEKPSSGGSTSTLIFTLRASPVTHSDRNSCLRGHGQQGTAGPEVFLGHVLVRAPHEQP